MKKRFLTVLVSLSVLFGMIPSVNVYSEENEKLSRAEGVVLGLVGISPDEYTPDKIITRGGFAKVIADLVGIDTDSSKDEWISWYYGDDRDDEWIIMDDGKTSGYFEDVDSSHPNYGEIMAVFGAGYMRGIADHRFAPEYDLSILEAAKVLADMSGYSAMAEMNGGYPSGYEAIAAKIGLLSGIKKGPREVMSYREVMEMIYNALNIKLVDFSVSNGNATFENNDKTFMEGVLETYRVKGAMTDNGITAVGSDSRVNKDEIVVAGVAAYLPEALISYRSFIGKIVDMYYTYEKDADRYVVKYMTVSDKDISITIQRDDFIDYNNGVISYSQGRKTVTKKVSKNVQLILNNKNVGVYDKSIFDFETGDITITATDGSTYNCIIINRYDFAYVESKNDAENTIYNGLKSNSDPSVNILKLDEDTYPDFVSIIDGNGNAITINEVAAGDILNIIRSDSGIDISISKEQVQGFTVGSLRTNEYGRKVISNGTDEFEVLDAFFASDAADEIVIGKTYTLYLNKFGKVAWVSRGNETVENGYAIGVVTKAVYDEEYDTEPLRQITIYTSDGRLTKFIAEEKISINNKRIKYDDGILSQLNDIAGEAVLYNLSKDGKITSLITAADYKAPREENRGWHRINPAGGTYRFGQNGYDFGCFFYYVAGRTKVMTVPDSKTDFNDEDNFSAGLAAFRDNVDYKAEAYAFSPNAVEAELIVLRQAATSGGTVNSRRLFLIQNISRGLSADDEEIIEMSGYQVEYGMSVQYLTLQIDPKAVMVSVGEPASALIDPSKPESEWGKIEDIGPRVPAELSVGDIIRYNTNAKGLVDTIRIAYDLSTKKPFMGGQGSESSTFTSGSSYAGDAFTKEGNGITLATASVPPELLMTDENKYNIRDNVLSFRVQGAVLVVEKKNKGISVRNGSIDDIRTYNDSRMAGDYDRVAIFTIYSSLPVLTVIYKK